MATKFRNARLMVVVLVVALNLILPNLVEAMRCGSRLVSIGDSKSKVLAKCGNPTTVDKGFGGYEVWIYNFGRNRQMKKLQFNRDRLEIIENAGRGSGASPQPGN
jgi:hypothetical protein